MAVTCANVIEPLIVMSFVDCVVFGELGLSGSNGRMEVMTFKYLYMTVIIFVIPYS
jgi:hypothetical protein